jgi:hypothetical protein
MEEVAFYDNLPENTSAKIVRDLTDDDIQYVNAALTSEGIYGEFNLENSNIKQDVEDYLRKHYQLKAVPQPNKDNTIKVKNVKLKEINNISFRIPIGIIDDPEIRLADNIYNEINKKDINPSKAGYIEMQGKFDLENFCKKYLED